MGLLGKPHHFRKPPYRHHRQAWSQNTGPGGPTAEERAVAQELGNGLLQLGPAVFWGAKGVADLGDEDPIFCDDEKKRSYIYIYVCLYVRHMMMFTTGTYFWMPFVWIYGIIWLVPSCLLLDLHMAMTDCDSWTCRLFWKPEVFRLELCGQQRVQETRGPPSSGTIENVHIPVAQQRLSLEILTRCLKPDVQFWTDLWNDQVVFSGWVAIRLTTCYNDMIILYSQICNIATYRG